MSWDAYFAAVDIDGESHWLSDWNYTHNTNRMADDALGEGSWWQRLNGSTGEEGYALLTQILEVFAADPAKFRAMNPDNGWGDFDRFRDILRNMADLSRRFPTGVWQVSG